MQGLHFDPVIAHALIGDTVHWSNSASDRHSSTSDGPTAWDSTRLNPWGGHYERVFPIAGAFPYYCSIHRSAGMTGTVQVATKVSPTSGTEATTFTATLAKANTTPPAGFVFVLQRALGTGSFTTIATTSSPTATFRVTAPGSYKLRSGLQKSGVAFNQKWFGAPISITVK